MTQMRGAESSRFLATSIGDLTMSDSYQRQSARKVFADELNSAHTMVQPGDGDQAPKFLVLPSGAKANRVSIAGVLTQVRDVGTEEKYLQAKVVDATGEEFWVYAGQYQKDALRFLEDAEPPVYITATCKPDTYERDDGSVSVSLIPEDVTETSSLTTERWAFEAARATVERLEGERGDESGRELAEAAHTDGHRQGALNAALEALEDLKEAVDTSPGSASESGEDTYTREELESMEYSDLRSIAAEFEGVSGNAPQDAIVEALVGQPAL